MRRIEKKQKGQNFDANASQWEIQKVFWREGTKRVLENEGNRVEEKRCEVDQQWGWRVVEAAMTGSG